MSWEKDCAACAHGALIRNEFPCSDCDEDASNWVPMNAPAAPQKPAGGLRADWSIPILPATLEIDPASPKHSHYFKSVAHLDVIDVYRVLELYDVRSPHLQHAIKKLLVAGGRGAGKNIERDVQEAMDTLSRWFEMRLEDQKGGD